MKTSVAVLFVIVIATAGAFAQVPIGPSSIFNAGILNPRAVTMPTPDYPESARQARHGGIVAVTVVVDESGLVISAAASPYDQHTGQNAKPTEAERMLDPTLMEAAESAARLATFKPFQIKGVPAKFTGRLNYNFIADNSNLPPRVGEIYGPLINARAINLPQPEWPAAARLANKSDTVSVHVTIDETGKVIDATAISGRPELRPAAEAAALRAEFKPWTILGEPVQIRGILTYQYSPKP